MIGDRSVRGVVAAWDARGVGRALRRDDDTHPDTPQGWCRT
ncbi:alpha-beta hydrolase superfamily lysophospholipase [Nakamurella sp. UYEF19]